MSIQLFLLWCISVTVASSMLSDQNGYLDVDCQQLQREYPGMKCLGTKGQLAYTEGTVERPAYTEDLQYYKVKRATRAKIRQILLDSYLNRIG